MKVILFLMFFITPPGPSDRPIDKRVWQLQSTTTMEFVSESDCKKVGEEIQKAANTAYTITARAWCFVSAGTPDFRSFQELKKGEPEKELPGVKIERLAPR